MCVIGAGRRARRGESMTEILKAYYPGLKIEQLPS
jgi:peptidoglycan hydrolase-like amidase